MLNREFSIRFQVSENVSVMLNFSVFHHFGKLTVNEGFCAVNETWHHTVIPVWWASVDLT